MDLKPTLTQADELAARIARIRKLCDDLAKAVTANDQQRELLGQMKQDADDAYKMLTKKT